MLAQEVGRIVDEKRNEEMERRSRKQLDRKKTERERRTKMKRE